MTPFILLGAGLFIGHWLGRGTGVADGMRFAYMPLADNPDLKDAYARSLGYTTPEGRMHFDAFVALSQQPGRFMSIVRRPPSHAEPPPPPVVVEEHLAPRSDDGVFEPIYPGIVQAEDAFRHEPLVFDGCFGSSVFLPAAWLHDHGIVPPESAAVYGPNGELWGAWDRDY